MQLIDTHLTDEGIREVHLRWWLPRNKSVRDDPSRYLIVEYANHAFAADWYLAEETASGGKSEQCGGVVRETRDRQKNTKKSLGYVYRSPSYDVDTYIDRSQLKIPRLYMDGWRDGLNRLWRDGVTILPRPAKKNATSKKKKSHLVPPRKKKQPPRPASEKKKTPRPASEKKKPAPSRLEKKQNAPSCHEQQNTPPRGWKLETNTTACLFFSLSCCTFISYCSLVRSIFLFFVFS